MRCTSFTSGLRSITSWQALAICQHLLGYSVKDALKEMPADFEKVIEEHGTEALRAIDAYAKAINAQVH